jgi:hypothetical protein
LKEVPYNIINIHRYTSTHDKRFDPRYPVGRETFHPQALEQERPFDHIVGLLKINFENNSILFFPMELMYRFMKNDDPFKDVSTPHECSLRWSNDMVCYLVNSVCSDFHEDFVTDI